MAILRPPKGTGFIDRNGDLVIRIKRGSSMRSEGNKQSRKFKRTAYGTRYRQKNMARRRTRGGDHPY